MKRGIPKGTRYQNRQCPHCGRQVKVNYFTRHLRSGCALGGQAPLSDQPACDSPGLLNQKEAAEICGMSPSTFRWHSHRAKVRGRKDGSTLWYTEAECQVVTEAQRDCIRRCKDKPKANPHQATTCEICGQPLKTHPRCQKCTILMGVGHEVQGAGPLCIGCRPQPKRSIVDLAWGPRPGVHAAGRLPRFGRPGAVGSGE